MQRDPSRAIPWICIPPPDAGKHFFDRVYRALSTACALDAREVIDAQHVRRPKVVGPHHQAVALKDSYLHDICHGLSPRRKVAMVRFGQYVSLPCKMAPRKIVKLRWALGRPIRRAGACAASLHIERAPRWEEERQVALILNLPSQEATRHMPQRARSAPREPRAVSHCEASTHPGATLALFAHILALFVVVHLLPRRWEFTKIPRPFVLQLAVGVLLINTLKLGALCARAVALVH